MKIQGEHHQGVHFDRQQGVLTILDQTLLPFQVKWLKLTSLADVCHAIASMQVRGAPAIGAVAAYGMVFAVREKCDMPDAARQLRATRPTAVNLAWAVERMLACLQNVSATASYDQACNEAASICREDVAACSAIGDAGLLLIEAFVQEKNAKTINILTHCNAGWLATVDWGTALAPIYKAHARGIDVHVWVDETRPRNQGALLTCFELQEQGVPHTLIADNAGGHLMQVGQVDMCIVGSDRTTANGDVCNKVGTYLKALAAADNNIPFYVALPVSTIDWSLSSGQQIPIEYRSEQEVLTITTAGKDHQANTAAVTLEGIRALNPAFDVTPARYVTGLITEYGVIDASDKGLAMLKARISDAG